MQRRKFIAGLGSLTAAGAAGIGTGAFTSVSADRNISVATAGDESAFLGLEAGDHPYVTGTDGGQMEIDLTETEAGGEGVNMNAVTTIGNSGEYETKYAFKITNQGTQPVFLGLGYEFNDDDWIETDSDQSYVELEGRGNELERVVGEYDWRRKAQFPFQADGETAGGRLGQIQPIYGWTRSTEYKTLDVGDAWYFVIRINTKGEDASIDDQLSGTLTIHAHANNEFGV